MSAPGADGLVVLCDFDGTVTEEDVCLALLDQFGAAGWRELEEQYERGAIDLQTCLVGQVALLDASRAEMAAWARRHVRLRAGFRRFRGLLRAAGAPIEHRQRGLGLLHRGDSGARGANRPGGHLYRYRGAGRAGAGAPAAGGLRRAWVAWPTSSRCWCASSRRRAGGSSSSAMARPTFRPRATPTTSSPAPNWPPTASKRASPTPPTKPSPRYRPA